MTIEELEQHAAQALELKVYINELIERKKILAGIIRRPPLLIRLYVKKGFKTDAGVVYVTGDVIEVFPEEIRTPISTNHPEGTGLLDLYPDNFEVVE